jgi:hypothetical protein
MDTNFQTSFIPKKPLAEDRVPQSSSMSLLSLIAMLILVVALALLGGVYWYRSNLSKNLISMNASLDAARNSFEPSLITELQTLDKRITAANQLLDSHIVISPIFAALEKNTLKSIQFTKFSYALASDKGNVNVRMSGKARDYASIALQSDQFSKVREIKDPIFSNLVLDERTGLVAFDLSFSVDPSLVKYTNHVAELTKVEGAQTMPVTQPATPTPATTTPKTPTPSPSPASLPALQ